MVGKSIPTQLRDNSLKLESPNGRFPKLGIPKEQESPEVTTDSRDRRFWLVVASVLRCSINPFDVDRLRCWVVFSFVKRRPSIYWE
jgi:hypothetical protein